MNTPHLYQLDADGRYTDSVTPGCEWARTGDVFVDVKWDGVHVEIDPSAAPEEQAQQVPDDMRRGMVSALSEGKDSGQYPLEKGTYTACKTWPIPNAENEFGVVLRAHNVLRTSIVPTDFETLVAYAKADQQDKLGLYWRHADGRTCKFEWARAK